MGSVKCVRASNLNRAPGHHRSLVYVLTFFRSLERCCAQVVRLASHRIDSSKSEREREAKAALKEQSALLACSAS